METKFMMLRLPEKLIQYNPVTYIWFALCSAVLPICFLLSVFDEVHFNKIVIMTAFAVLCIWIFGKREHKMIGKLSITDRFVIAMVLAIFLTTLRASDLMADYQAVAYTHIEELQRLFAAAVIACFVYQYQKKAFRVGMLGISWIIWGTAVYQLYQTVPQLVAVGDGSISTLQSNLLSMKSSLLGCSVYRHPIPCATAFVIGIALPLVWKWWWLDLILKLIYIPSLIIAYARSGWIGSAVVLLLTAFEMVHRRHPKIGKMWILIIAVPAGVIVLLYLWIFRFDIRADGIGGMQNGRLRYWRYVLTVMFPERPLISKLFGNGFYTSIVMDQTPVVQPGFPAIDNGFITLLYEQGILGFAAVMCLLVRAFCSVWRSDEDKKIAVALIGAAVTGVFYEIQFWSHIGFLITVMIAVFFGRKTVIKEDNAVEESGL